MKITTIEIDGYRLLNGFTMNLRDDLSLIIGKNNTGKTSLLNVLSSFLSSSTSPEFRYEDFSIHLQKDLRQALLSKQPQMPSQGIKISLKIVIEYDETDNLRRLSRLMVDLRPETRTVHLCFNCELTADKFEMLHNDVQRTLKGTEEALNDDIGAKTSQKKKAQLSSPQHDDEISRFLSKRLPRYLTNSIISFDPADELNFFDLSKEVSLIREIIQRQYVSAKRSVENKEAGHGGKAAARTLSQLSSTYFDTRTKGSEETPAFIRLAAQAAATDRTFTSTYEEVFGDIVEKVKKFGGTPDINDEIHVVSEIQPDQLLKSNTTVRYGKPDSLLPEDHNGLGYLNLIAIIMEIEIRLLRMNGNEDRDPADINILFIEEPEAHTHPQLQYIFVRQVKRLLNEHKSKDGLNLQTVLTTHSSHITAESDFADIKYFRRDNNRVRARDMTELEDRYENIKAYHFLTQYLTLTRAELFFADKAVLIEGDTERILMRAMMRKLDAAGEDCKLPLSSQNISIVEVGAYSHIFADFIEFTGLKTLLITDIDSAKRKDAKSSQLEACRVDVGTHTTNQALKHYLGLPDLEDTSQGSLGYLRSLTTDSKKLSRSNGSWTSAGDAATLFVAYQTEEEGYEARSFEDAFIHINRGFISRNKGTFQRLKHKDYFSDSEKGAYELATSCIAKKTHFALDVVFHDADIDEATITNSDGNDTAWKTPAYINEGLRWLRDA